LEGIVSWRERAENIRARQSCMLPKPTKPAFGSFGSFGRIQGGALREKTVVRTVVRFRLPGGCSRSWCAAIGVRPREEIIAEIRQKYGDAEILE
jgi:hypothetical protein